MEWLAQVFVPAIIRDLSAKDQKAAQTFVELPWPPLNPALPIMTTSTSPDASGKRFLTFNTSTRSWALLNCLRLMWSDRVRRPQQTQAQALLALRQPPRSAQGQVHYSPKAPGPKHCPSHTAIQTTTPPVTAPESTAVESFKMSPPSTHESPSGPDTTPAEPEGPADNSTRSRYVLSSLEFAKPPTT